MSRVRAVLRDLPSCSPRMVGIRLSDAHRRIGPHDMSHPEKSRVIVTVDVDGQADYHEHVTDRDVVLDESGRPAYLATQLWGTPDGEAVVGTGIDPAKVSDPWFPDPGGIRFRLFTFKPMSELEEPPQTNLGASVSAEPSNFLDAYDAERP